MLLVTQPEGDPHRWVAVTTPLLADVLGPKGAARNAGPLGEDPDIGVLAGENVVLKVLPPDAILVEVEQEKDIMGAGRV